MAKKIRVQPAEDVLEDLAPGRERKTSPIQIKADLAKKLGVIAQHRNRTITALVDPLLRAWVEAEFATAIREMHRDLDPQ